jgi:hypothetical protein
MRPTIERQKISRLTSTRWLHGSRRGDHERTPATWGADPFDRVAPELHPGASPGERGRSGAPRRRSSLACRPISVEKPRNPARVESEQPRGSRGREPPVCGRVAHQPAGIKSERHVRSTRVVQRGRGAKAPGCLGGEGAVTARAQVARRRPLASRTANRVNSAQLSSTNLSESHPASPPPRGAARSAPSAAR